MAQRRIDRMNEVEAGIDERAVEIEDNKSDGVRIEWTPALNHYSQDKRLAGREAASPGAPRSDSGIGIILYF
jgi:hypothetical protein